MKWTYDLVVLIDCWPSHYEVFTNDNVPVTEFYKRLVNKLSTMRFTNVALATYRNSEKTDDNENGTFDTDPYLLEHLKSYDQGSNINAKHCLTFQDVFRKFPELLYTEENPKILLGGLSFYHCTHWRPLGIMQWLEQQTPVHTCVDLCGAGLTMSINEDMLAHDPMALWEKELPHDDDPPGEEYDDIWKARRIGYEPQEFYKELIPYQYAPLGPSKT